MAAKYLCIPASSAKVERVFSQSGIIDTPLRNRLGALTLEVLTLLKAEWNDSLYSMTHKEKVALINDFRRRAKEAGLKDPTERLYGIEQEEEEKEEEETVDQNDDEIPLPPAFRLMEEAGNVDFSYIDEPEAEETAAAVNAEGLNDIVSVSDSECPDLSDLDIDDLASSEEEDLSDGDLEW